MSRNTVRYGPASCDMDLVERSLTDRHYLLTWLVVPYECRGKGYASRLVEICKFIARQDSLPIRLWAGKGTDAFDQQALFEFYQRHGFEFFDVERPTWLEWRP